MISSRVKLARKFKLKASLDAFKGRNVPEWLAESKGLKGKKTPNKIFHHIGIPNFKDAMPYEKGSSNDHQKLADGIINALYGEIQEQYDAIKDVEPQFLPDTLASIIHPLGEFLTRAKAAIYGADARRKDGKTEIIVNEYASFDGSILIQPGQSIFKAYSKVGFLLDKLKRTNPKFSELPMPVFFPIDMLPAVKKFHKDNLPDAQYFVVFSGNGDESAWDIATMSMRGIESCQSWDNETHREGVVGSILSKFVGIIYLTSGSEMEHGSRMIKRCLVRFGVSCKDKKPYIILDTMYNGYDAQIAEMFIEALRKRSKYQVLNYAQDAAGTDALSEKDISIPRDKEIEHLDEPEFPYSDRAFKLFEGSKKSPKTPSEMKEFFNEKRQDAYFDANDELLAGFNLGAFGKNEFTEFLADLSNWVRAVFLNFFKDNPERDFDSAKFFLRAKAIKKINERCKLDFRNLRLDQRLIVRDIFVKYINQYFGING